MRRSLVNGDGEGDVQLKRGVEDYSCRCWYKEDDCWVVIEKEGVGGVIGV